MATSPLFVSRFGSGRPILALHGIEAHGLRYIGLAAHLEGYQIIAPDLHGHGRSPRTGPFTLEQHALDVLPLLRELGPDATLLGHSYGAVIAWELAQIDPDAVSRLVLVDPPIQVAPEFARRSFENATVHLRWPNRERAFEDLIAGRSPEAHWSVALDVSVGLERTDSGDLRVAVSEEAVRACWEQLPSPLPGSSFRGPTLLIEAGQENGDFCTPAAVADLRRLLGDRLRHEVVDLPHTITADGPDILAAHLLSFLAR